MLRRWVIGAAAAACLVSTNAASWAGSPADGGPSRRAALLASHGEPRLAWDELRNAGPARTDAEAALAIRLLTELGRFAQADSLLARDAAPKGDPTATWYYLQRARLNLAADRPDRALELLAAVSCPPTEPLGAYVELVRAQALTKKGDALAASIALDRARTPWTPEALAAPIDDERVKVLRALGRSIEAIAALDDGIAHAVDGPERRRLLAERYEVALETGADALASSAALALLEEYRGFPEAQACALEVTRPLRASGVSAASTRLLFACAEVFAARERPDDLHRVLRALDTRGLQGADAEYLRLLWGEYHYETGNFSRAIALARPSYADPTYKRRSNILLARALRGAGRKAEAASVYEQFVLAFPNDTIAAEALYAAASLREESGQIAASERLLDQLRRSYPSSFHGWAAAMRRAQELEKGGDVDAAADIFEQWLTRSRRTDEAALFYLSQLESKRAGENASMLMDELRRMNPYSFYVAPDVGAGARGPMRDASGSIERDGAGSLSTWLAGTASERDRAYQRVIAAAESERDGTGDDLAAREALERGRRFLGAGFRDWAERELEVVRRRPGISPDLALVLARTYEEYAMPWRSMRAFERARVAMPWETRREYADDFRYLMYPLPYPAQVFDAAAQGEVPAHLIYAIMREESRFETDAVSRAGAVGLMQLMPETARRIARGRELGPDVGSRLDDPSVNVAIGTWYASDLLRQGDGSVAWMLAAYNAGPGAAKRWLPAGVSGDDAIAAVESIDYRETRGYVKRVVESANVYHSLYFGNSGAKNSPR
jgi:soluble lytic murein transglycosylase